MRRSPLLQRIRRGLAEPYLVARECNRLYYRLRQPNARGGVEFFEEDWDNLLLLDACRYDIFDGLHDLPGTLEHRRTKSSSTVEFLHTYFDGADLTDTVYVTANPRLQRELSHIDVRLHDIVHVWREEGWDDEFKTVQPETVYGAAVEAAETYPEKRLVVHFLQPHYPFIGPTGRANFDADTLAFWHAFHRNEVEVSDDLLWQAYRENLELVLPAVRRLMGTLEGRTVVSADHGQMLGDRAFPVPMREYGHPTEVHSEELTKVPWLVHERGDRRRIVAEAGEGKRDRGGDPRGELDGEAVDDTVRERLQQLGYR